jgi:DNA primase
MNLKDLLDKRGIEYRLTNNPNEILIACTSGEHVDKSPSLSFNIEKDIFNCWSCGYKGGTDRFLASIGELPIIDVDSKQPYKTQKLKDKIKQRLEVDAIKLPDDRRVFKGDYRGITEETYRMFGAFTTNELGLQDYLCLPVYQYGKLKFIEGRALKDLEHQSKYFRRPQAAVVSDCLFPLDKITHTNYIILVEGIFDAINMWQLGYSNVLCTFGTTNFSKTKLDMLDNLGVTRVDIMMDSDRSGRKAAEKIANMLDVRNIYARIIEMPKGVDPGEITAKTAELLLK